VGTKKYPLVANKSVAEVNPLREGLRGRTAL